MCTVTYIPMQNGFILTSSRDEKIQRATIKPSLYQCKDNILIYPKDQIANGTWIAASNKNKIACLLNGAFKNHIKKANYTKSRGEILLNCFEYKSFKESIFKLDLNGVEPFTLLFLDYSSDVCIHQLIWDGMYKHMQVIPNYLPRIWSSVTLYSKNDHIDRQNWFNNWLEMHKKTSDFNVLKFHTSKHCTIDSKDILMKRENDIQTVSVSQIKFSLNKKQFLYIDLIKESKSIINFSKLK